MSLRDVFVMAVVIGALPVSFLRPWVGVLVFSWLGYMTPHRLTWGFAHDFPAAQLVAVAVLGGLLVTKERQALPLTREVVLLLLLWSLFGVSTLFAVYPDDALAALVKLSKILVMTLVTMMLFQDRTKLRLLLWVIALSLGFYGVKAGVWGILTGGQHRFDGPEGSFLEGNTNIGLALVMNLPILWYLREDESRSWLRWTLLGACALSIVAILVTYSRGAFLGLVAVLGMLALRGRNKAAGVFILCVTALVIALLLPEQWSQRMETIQGYEQDNSSMERIDAWTFAWRVGVESPLVGAGFRCFTPEMYQRYYPESRNYRVDAHSIFFQVLAEHGFTGLILFATLLVCAVLSLERIKSITRGHREHAWAHAYAQMLQACFVGYIVCGLFLSRSYFDLFYQLLAVAVVLKRLVDELPTVESVRPIKCRLEMAASWPGRRE